jgi:excisionase family DNA binding protein
VTPEIEPLWTWKEVAAYLGCGRTKILNMAATGEIPSLRVGNRLKFVPARVREWVEHQQRRTA